MTAGGPSADRRAVLAGVAAGLGGVGGCVTALSSGERRGEPVSLLVAGSLYNALENGLQPRTETPLEIEAHGSARVARLVAEGQKDPDIVAVADVALFDAPLSPDWFAAFATNSLVVVYNPDTEGGRRLADAGTDGWYRPLLDGDVALGRTDPDLDPLGYRTLFLLDLATDYYGTDVDLRAAIPAPGQVYPETQLVGQFETGAIEAAVAYRNMAVERGYEYIDLPRAIDLSDPRYADRYATATYELPSGTVVRGGLVTYGATTTRRTDEVVELFEALTTGRYLTEFGFVVPDDYPRHTGNAPDRLAN